MSSLDDTILAVATPPGVAPRAVVRLSGPAAVDRVAALDAGGRLGKVAGFRGVGVSLRLGSVEVPAWAAVFRAPRSYTREDMTELHLPSSAPLVSMVARELLAGDIRWAWPGEFTLRAFLNGRLDLARAEAVAQVIAATDAAEAKAARRCLAGELGRAVEKVGAELTAALALLEAGIDFADEGLPEIAPDVVLETVGRVKARLEELRRSTSLRLSAAGVFHVVLAGFPNAGKSSLLNAVLGRPAALVSDLAGTTRDPVRGTTLESGSRLEWVDLAGSFSIGDLLRPGSGPAAGLDVDMNADLRRAVRRLTRVEIEHADLVLWVVDPRSQPGVSLAEFDALGAASGIIVVNKVDELSDDERAAWRRARPGASLVSARSGEGVADLVARVARSVRGSPGARAAGRPMPASPHYVVSAHQEAALEAAARAMKRATDALEDALGFEYAAADLRDALKAVEDLCGKVTPDKILAHIFSRFCVGK